MNAHPLAFDRETARRIALVGLDVDGVMTDGGLYMGGTAERPIELKRFHVQDGIGVLLLRESGLKVAIVSGRVSAATTHRAAELQVEHSVQDAAADKRTAFERILAEEGLAYDEAAFMGDDLPDIPVLRRVALGVAVRNAVDEVKQVASHVTTCVGGHGAIREFAEALLRARDEWEGAVERYLAERGETSPWRIDAVAG